MTKDMDSDQRREFDNALDDIRYYEEREKERKALRRAEIAAMQANLE